MKTEHTCASASLDCSRTRKEPELTVHSEDAIGMNQTLICSVTGCQSQDKWQIICFCLFVFFTKKKDFYFYLSNVKYNKCSELDLKCAE